MVLRHSLSEVVEVREVIVERTNVFAQGLHAVMADVVVAVDAVVMTAVVLISQEALSQRRLTVLRGSPRCWTCPKNLSNALGMNGRPSRLMPHVGPG